MGKPEKNHTRIPATIGTILFAGLTVLILLVCGLKFPIPPPPEYGIEVNLGYTDVGLGQEAVSENMENPVSASETSNDEEAIITSNEEDAPALAFNSKPTPKKKVTLERKENKIGQKKEPIQEPKQEINPQALYTGKKKNNTGASSSEGIKEGEGDMGKPDGTLRSNAYQGGGSGGVSFSLSGRTLMRLVKPEYNSEEQGIVVVKIWVDRQGAIVRTQVGVQGTTTMDESLWATAKKAALSSRFVPKESAPEEQIGTISYKFVIGQ